MSQRALILLHSATGNTRLVARFAAHRLEGMGLSCRLHDIQRAADPPSLEDVDLLGVAFPVMYGNPTLAIQRYLAHQVPHSPDRLPAFVLATASGEPFAALPLMSQQLQSKGFAPVGAHWVIAPTSFPGHIAPLRLAEEAPVLGSLMRATEPLGRKAWTRWSGLRVAASSIWLDASTPTLADRQALVRFLYQVVDRAGAAGDQARPRHGDCSGQGLPGMARVGRLFKPESIARRVRLHSDPALCQRCGACVMACPVHCIAQDEMGYAHIGAGCTACHACYNACTFGAISTPVAPRAIGRYTGPTDALKKLFQLKR